MWYYRALHRHLGSCLEQSLGNGPVRLIDAGCGTGGFLRRLAAAHPDWQLTGIDASPLAVALALWIVIPIWLAEPPPAAPSNREGAGSSDRRPAPTRLDDAGPHPVVRLVA